MSLRSNQTEQMAKRLKQDLEKLAPEYTLSVSADADNNPILTAKSGSTSVAVIRMARRSFEGFNIVNELSSSVGQGYPEHDCYLAFNDDLAHEAFAKIFKCAAAIGCSALSLCKIAHGTALTDASPTDGNVTAELPNNARLGSIGA